MGALPKPYLAKFSAKAASDRGQATHIAMKLLQDDFGNVIRLASTRRLPGLMCHKAENLVDRVRRRNEALDKNFLKAVQHQRWASLCCRHMADFLARLGVTEILAIEQRLPDVEVAGLKEVDTGEMDVIAYSPALGGVVAVEIKTRYRREACRYKHGRAMENAAGMAKWLAEKGYPPLVEMVWVFYTPHPLNVHIPLANERVLNYRAEDMEDYFEKRHGGVPSI